jgi:anti-sigma28 factor (negative regulator of flagellin synthesis)
MPTKKKTPSKGSPTIAIEGAIPKLKLDFPLDDKKVEEIKRCIAKGKLAITISRVDLVAGRLGDPYKYD